MKKNLLLKRKILSLLMAMVFIAFNAKASTASPHDTYLALYKVDYNPETELLQISLKMFTHDLETAILNTKGANLQLGTSRQLAGADSILVNYLLGSFWLKADGEALDIRCLGWEIDPNDSHTTWAYFELEGLKAFTEMEVYSSLMVKHFPGHSNLFFITVGDAEKSIMLNLEQPRQRVDFGLKPNEK